MTRRIPPQHRRKVRMVSRNYATNWKNHRADGTFKKSKRGKYNARGEWIDEHFFASAAEAGRYLQLKELQQQGRISDLELQPPFACYVSGRLVCTYRADFRYRKRGVGIAYRVLVEDVKGMVTKEYALKRKLVAALHPAVEIYEIPAASVPRCRLLTADEVFNAQSG